jgi:hypothetical protein
MKQTCRSRPLSGCGCSADFAPRPRAVAAWLIGSPAWSGPCSSGPRKRREPRHHVGRHAPMARRRVGGRSAFSSEDIGGCPHLSGQVLAGFSFGSLAHFFFGFADCAA